MSEGPKDGGPAFPLDTGSCHYQDGMSLRDYFAAAALPQSIQHIREAIERGVSPKTSNDVPEAAARLAYQMADAMLAHRDGDMPWCGRCQCYHHETAEHVR